MFVFLGVLLFLLGCVPLIRTLTKADTLTRPEFRKRLQVALGILVADLFVIMGFNIFFHYYTELFWFENLGFANRFWTVFRFKIWFYLLGAGFAFVFMFVNFRSAFPKIAPGAKRAAWFLAAISALLLGFWTSGLWEQILLYMNQVSSETADPIFGKSVSFYLFSLPLYSDVVGWLIFLVLLTLGLIGGVVFVKAQPRSRNMSVAANGRHSLFTNIRSHLLSLSALLLFVLAWNFYLNIYRLMYSGWGAVTGAGYLDVHLRILGYQISLVVFVLAGVLLLVGAFSEGFRRKLFALSVDPESGKESYTGKSLIFPASAVALVLLFTWLIPGLVMTLKVKPNEITLEKPFIEHNIRYTQLAYGIDDSRIEEREYTVGGNITQEIVDKNPNALQNIRLWDWRALRDNLKEQQEIRLYYEFDDVDIDRYRLNGEYRQVMLATRELEKSQLDPRSQTWVSQRLKYTHGHGLVLLPVHEFLLEGKPNLLIQNIPPQEKVESLKISRPEIYYGEATEDHVYVRTTEKEFDYPRGNENVYSTYEGKGGVTLDSFFKKFAYAWKFDGHRLLFSTYFTPESRILFDRDIKTRVAKIAPFLMYDQDPYPVLTEDGRIKYILDAYTISENYPYSEAYEGSLLYFRGIRYIRNAVKVVIDAYDGSVTFYVFDDTDVLIQTYKNIFPELFKSVDQTSVGLRRHVRYPDDLLTVQAEMFSTYHMEDVDVFYQREDVWQFATERYRENFQRVVPYYVMVHFPEEQDMEFVLMIPFTPKNKNVINAWMAGRCDIPHYGKLTVFTFPKGVEVLGPRQIEARIDQNTDMSKAMTLWGQRGSEVIRGNLLAIPLFSENVLYLLYAEPIFLQAENAQLPEIKRIAVADQHRVVWAETFDEALKRLVGEAEMLTDGATTNETFEALTQRALENLKNYQKLIAEGKFSEAGKHLEELNNILNQLSENVQE
ncbi:UPF0182 family protein [candidate division KSB1 bacterium]|nr:UPF0182 family protein [candidate division KSB1 bacterium]NIR68512.1 UPF0182 family protein [candidate division KSB1 bacterium]NIS22526.1 UPF0182 family protein [candidate division KSB1 bacterium]NIT69370.1 UPF0182 family protein [candidate division KSB1 bacterium]NIU23031.1 UPF0182 family protein [candidate division KSB1 bacterium]